MTERAETKIKICGLSRAEDICYVNEARPDYCGFVIGVPKSRRNVTEEQLRRLRRGLQEGITPVGVFVNADPRLVAKLLEEGLIDAAQLHGGENEEYIRKLREMTEPAADSGLFRIRGAGILTGLSQEARTGSFWIRGKAERENRLTGKSWNGGFSNTTLQNLIFWSEGSAAITYRRRCRDAVPGRWT